MVDKVLKIFRITWFPTGKIDCRNSIVIETNERRAVDRLIKERAHLYPNFIIDNIEEIEFREGIIGHYWC